MIKNGFNNYISDELEACPLCTDDLSKDFVDSITSASAEASQPISVKHFLELLAIYPE